MKEHKYYLITLTLFLSLNLNLKAQEGDGQPLKFISSCEIDLNNDEKSDIALLVETIRGRELIVLMQTITGYDTYLVSKGKPEMYLSCRFGKFIQETSAGKGEKKGNIFTTPGTYLELVAPEVSSVAYFWNGKGFTEVSTSD
jgi:hypothetical protein